MSTEVISTVEEALAYIAAYHEDGAEIPVAKLSGHLAEFSAEVEGKNYNSSIPAELARGLWEYQDQIYRAVAFALYGVDDIRKLNAEQRSDFELVFHVSQGSTDLMAPLTAFLEKLGEGIKGMDSKHIAITLVLVAVVMATAWGGISVVDSNAEVKKAEVSAQLDLGREKEKTAQFELFSQLAQSNQVAARFSKATEEGTKAIIKGASDATSIKVGKVSFTKDEIQEVNQRAVKERASAQIISDRFKVFRADFREASFTKFYLSMADGTEFQVNVPHEDFDADSLQKLWQAARDRSPLELEINATIVRGQIKTAQIVKVL